MYGIVFAGEMFPLNSALGSSAAAFFRASRRRRYFLVRPPSPQSFQLGALLLGNAFINVKNVRRLFFDHEFIYTDNDFFLRLRRSLILVRSLGNFFLRISTLDRLYHSAHGVEFVEVIERAFFHLQCQTFQKIRPAQRIHRLRHARLISNDLLGAQCDTRGFFGRQRESFVVSVGVQ